MAPGACFTARSPRGGDRAERVKRARVRQARGEERANGEVDGPARGVGAVGDAGYVGSRRLTGADVN